MQRFFATRCRYGRVDHLVATKKLRRAHPQGMLYMHATRARGGTNNCEQQPTPFFSHYNFDLPAE
jgi:hypothetical protein